MYYTKDAEFNLSIFSDAFQAFTTAMRYLITLLVLAFCCLAGSAQKFKGGLSLGFSATQIDGDGYMGFNKIGLDGGGFVNTDLSKRVSAQFEILYVDKGSVKPTNPSKNDYTYRKIKLQYVELPLVLKYDLPIAFKDSMRSYKFRVIIEGGLSYGRLIASKEEDENGVVPLIGPFHKSEYAFHFGVTYPISKHIYANIRYTRSLLPIADDFVLILRPSRWGFFGGSYSTVLAFSLRYQFVK